MKIIHIRHKNSIEFIRCNYYEFNPSTQRAIVSLNNDNVMTNGDAEWIHDAISLEEMESDLFTFDDRNKDEFRVRLGRINK